MPDVPVGDTVPVVFAETAACPLIAFAWTAADMRAAAAVLALNRFEPEDTAPSRPWAWVVAPILFATEIEPEAGLDATDAAARGADSAEAASLPEAASEAGKRTTSVTLASGQKG